MRYALYMILVLMLAACGGGGSDEAIPSAQPPTQNQQEQPEASTDEAAPNSTLSFEELAEDVLNNDDEQPVILPSATPASEGALPVPLPGTLVASETEEPEPRVGPFDIVRFRQSGGPADIDIYFEIRGDTRELVFGEQTVILPPETIQEIDQFIVDLNFMGLQATFMGPAQDDNDYVYRVTVIDGAISRAIMSQDGYMPEQYRQFLGLLRSASDEIVNALEPTIPDPETPETEDSGA